MGHRMAHMPGPYAYWMDRWERKLATRDTNRVVRPFEWGTEWLTCLDPMPTGWIAGSESSPRGTPTGWFVRLNGAPNGCTRSASRPARRNRTAMRLPV